jgi:ribosomal-protein-alanine N-acetyltransferase
VSAARKGWPRRGRTLAASLGTGERVFVRNPVAGDRDEWVALRSRSRSFLRPWDPRPPQGFDPCGPEAFDRMLRGSRDPRREALLVCRIEDRAILGQVNASEIVRGSFQSAYLGYWIGREFARQGHMREGLALAIDHAFGLLGLHRVEANVRPENAPSLALVERLGFTREGFSRRYLSIAGRWCDHERWALLAEDWRHSPERGRRRRP